MEQLRDLPARRARPQRISFAPISCYDGWRTSIAVRPEQFLAAQELVCRRYAWRGYHHPRFLRFGGDEERPSILLLAEKSGKLMGTVTVRPDSRQGLLAEQAYPDVIARLRDEGHRLGEVTGLAVEEGADWRTALDALVQCSYLMTRVVHALTDVVIEVNPRHARFYERVFGFAATAAERLCARVGAPSVLLRLDLERFGAKLKLAA